MQPPAEFKTLPDMLRWRVAETPEQAFLRMGERSLTYAEFDARTDELAGGLVELSVSPGDVVSVMLPNCIEFIEAWWAVLKVGGVFGPVNPAYTDSEAGYVIGHSQAVAVVTNAHGASLLAGQRGDLPKLRTVISLDGGGDAAFDQLLGPAAPISSPGRGPEDLAAILYTSGTTGKPKGVMLSHRNQLVNAAQGAEVVPLSPGERVGMLLPLFHVNAQVTTTLIPIAIGLEVVMWERFSASTFWSDVDRLRPVSISAVPTILAAVLDAPGAPSSPRETTLRYVICGAAPLSAGLLHAFQEKFGIRVLEGYGLTETTCISSLNPYYGERKAGSIGLPVRGQKMRIIDGDGQPLAAGEYGEIVVAGPNVTAGYLDNAEASAEALRGGWLHTGDIGFADEDGYFYIVDRSKDMIIRSGENIYPREIEEVLYAHGGVLECAVIGVPDAYRGEEVLAVVAPLPGRELDIGELEAFAASRLAKYKLPRAYVTRATLPKTATGKISKGPLREEFGSGRDPRVETGRLTPTAPQLRLGAR